MSSNLIWNIKTGDAENVKDILEKEVSNAILFIIVDSLMLIRCCCFAKQKLDVNGMIDGRRPLHFAADYGQKEIIEYLIQLGADVNVNNIDQQ